MITLGFVPKYSDAVTVDTAFTSNGLTLLAAYVSVSGSSGDIVWENSNGEAQWCPGTLTGQSYLMGATRILSTGTVNGTLRTTTATGLVWWAVNQLYNTP